MEQRTLEEENKSIRPLPEPQLVYQSGEIEIFARVIGITGAQNRKIHLKLANEQRQIRLNVSPTQVAILHQFIPNQDWILLKAHARWVENDQDFRIDPKSLSAVEFVYYDQADQKQVAEEAENTVWRYQFSRLSDEEKLLQCADDEQKQEFEEWLAS